MGRLNIGMGCTLAALIVGCSHANTEVTIKEESAGLHLPSGIAQLVRPVVTIQELTPAQSNDTVHIEGTVTGRAPLLSGSLYQVADDSGSVWVMSAEPAPATAAVVTVVGTLQLEPISIEDIDISDLYIQETSRTVTQEEAAPAEADTATDQTDSSGTDSNVE